MKLNSLNLIKTHPLNSFLKFYVMTSPEIDLYGIAHVKVDFIPLQKMYVIPILGRFVWTTYFVQCAALSQRSQRLIGFWWWTKRHAWHHTLDMSSLSAARQVPFLFHSLELLERPSISRIIDLGPLRAIWAYSKLFLFSSTYLHRNVAKSLLHSHGNIDKIFCKMANNIFHIENSGNFKTNFFLNLYLRIFLVKQVSSKNCSFYGLPLWHLHWFSGLDIAPNLHNFCIVV